MTENPDRSASLSAPVALAPPLLDGGPIEPAIAEWLRACIAQLARISIDEVGAEMPFEYFGLDSVSAVELVAAIESWLGEELSPALSLDYPTVRELSAFLASRVEARAPS